MSIPGVLNGLFQQDLGTTSAQLTWTPPSGGLVTAYKITPYIGSSAQTATTVQAPATGATVPDLSAGTAYTFRVQAMNPGNKGPLSAASNAVTPSSALKLPRAVA